MLNTAIIGRWKEKYSEQHHGATGDATTAVAVTSYRERHHLLDNLTQVAYEKYTRAAYTEFVLNDPWYIVQLKYYNLMTVTDVSKTVITQAWGYLGWRGLALIACVAVALVAQIRSNTESFTVLTGLAGSLIVCAIMAAGPIWATVPNIDLMGDMAIVLQLASFTLALWAVVGGGVLLGMRGRRL